MATPLFALFLCATAPLHGQATAPKLTHGEAFGAKARAFTPRIPSVHSWASDGRSLEASDRKGVLIDPKSGDERPRPSDEGRGARKAAPRAAFEEALQNAAELRGRPDQWFADPAPSTLPRTMEPQSGLVVDAKGEVHLARIGPNLYRFTESEGLKKLRTDLSEARQLRIDPTGRRASLINGFDLQIVDLKDGALVPVSTDGSEDLFYGELDWVYQEEVYGRFNFQGAFWSPTGEHLAYLRTEESGVDTFTVIDHLPTTLRREELKYPKAGTVNPRATLHVAGASDGKSVAVDLSAYSPEDEILIVRVGWTPEGDAVIFQVQNREQTWLDLVSADPKTGKSTRLFREGSKTWVNVLLDAPRWLKDGSFLWDSERTGYRHIYHYKRNGELIRAVTSGEWQVKDLTHLDEEAGIIEFTATEVSAIDTHHYRIGLNGEGFLRLTRDRGTHRLSWNADRSLCIDEWSSFDQPGQQRLLDKNGEVLRILSSAEMPSGAITYGMSLPIWQSIPARDGYPLDATVLKPLPFDPEKSYPVWLETYSGPDAPTVANRWSSSAWHQFLAQQGYIVLQVNVRSASGRGQKHTETCYQQFCLQELKDLEDAVRWLTSHSWADQDRVGLTGWSYGGTITAFALTNSKLFKLGIAGAGVYDWRNYDTIYTERYMRTPQNNPDGYRNSSVLTHAEDLHGHLVIIHGTIDDNVHFQNAVQLVYALQNAGKSFDFMMYPNTRHGVRSPRLFRHWRDYVWEKIQAHL